MRVIAVANQKGGTGKTTTAVCLAGAIAENGKRVLLVDLDSSANATTWLGAQAASAELLDAWIAGDLSQFTSNTSIKGITLIPGAPALATADRRLAGEVGAEGLLRRALAPLSASYDVCLLDCPPSLGLVGVAALVAADEVLVPVETRALPLEGLRDLLDTAEAVRARGLNPTLAIRGMLPVKYDGRTNLSREVLTRLRNQFPDQVLATTIRELTRIAEAPLARTPITVYDPDGRGAHDYRCLAQELAV